LLVRFFQNDPGERYSLLDLFKIMVLPILFAFLFLVLVLDTAAGIKSMGQNTDGLG